MPKIVDHAQQRRELSATVAEVIAQSGLEHSTLRTVAARHGCTKGMVQHYFSDKEALLAAALRFVEDRFSAGVDQATEGLEGLEAVHAALRAQLPSDAGMVADWQVRLVFHTRPDAPPEMRALLQQYRAEQQDRLMSALRKAQRARELRSGLPLLNSLRSLQALVWGLGLGTAADPESVPLSAQRQILKTAIEGLRA